MIKRIFLLICVYTLAGCGSGGGGDSASSLVPSIGLSVSALTFDSPGCGPNPAGQTFQIANTGQGTLAWSISNRPSWLLLTPESGPAPAAVTAQVNAAGLACGETYSQTLQVVGAGAGNTPVSLPVTLTLGPAAPLPPTLGIHPGTMTVDFAAAACGGTAASTAPSFEVINAGIGTFNWSATANRPWIQFAPSSGVPGASVTVQNIDASNFPCGMTSSGVIQIASSEAVNSPIAVTVNVAVPSAATITPSVLTLPFFATSCKTSPPARQFTIQNTGGTPLGWSAMLAYTGVATGWAAVNSLSGTVAAGGTSAPITVTADASALPCGQGYSATLTLTATSGGNAVSPVLPKTIPIGLSNPTAWEHQHPTPTGDNLRKVVFSEPGIAWVAGEGGTVLRSNNSGSSWTRVASGTMANLNAIAFAGPAKGWIAGDTGTVLHTIDGGATWSPETSGVGTDLLSLSAVDASNVWAVGKNKTILYRNNSAQWAVKPGLSALDPITEFDAIFMNDAIHGRITGQKDSSPKTNYLLWTDDNWTTAQPQTIGPNPNTSALFGVLSSIFLLADHNEGWLAGNVDTTGQGTILQLQSSGPASSGVVGWQTSGASVDLGDIYFSDPNNGWAAGDNGTIIHTSNGGIQWSTLTSGSPPQFLKSFGFDSGNGIAVGLAGSVLNTADGTNWVPMAAGMPSQFNAVSFAPDGLHGWVAGSLNTILTTSNGGVTWSQAPGTHSGFFNGIHAVASNDVWAAAKNRNIYHFNGTTWSFHTAIPGSGTTETLNGIFFLDASKGWAVGNFPNGGDNQIYYYNGSAWNPERIACSPITTSAMTMNAVHFIGATHGWIAGSGGMIARTINNSDWTCTLDPSAPTWKSIFFVDASTGWVVGSGGKISSTNDGGASWTAQTDITWVDNSNAGAPLNKVYFADANHGWIAGGTGGASGFILATADGGLHWTQQRVTTTQALNGMYFKDANEGWAVGNNGTIVHTTLGGQ